MTDLPYLPATEALRMFRSRELSPVELMSALIERAEAVEPQVNAMSERMFDEALLQAEQAERAYRAGCPRPLEGIPAATKDEQPIAGRIASDGSLAHAGHVAEVTHPVVERIVAAGGIVHARTTTPEFCCAAFTHSKLWGVTRNPWNLDYSPGGSSGGSGAVLASGTAVLATGSDIGGSIRLPAANTGTVGYKPPYGRVPAMPPFNLDHYCHDGPMARTVADCALLQNVIAGPHPHDVVSLRPAVRIPDRLGDVAGMRIAYAPNLGDWEIEPDIAANTLAVADALREAGAVVEEVAVGLRRADVMRAAFIHFGAVFGPMVGRIAAAHGDTLTRYALDFAAQARTTYERGGGFLAGLEMEAAIYRPIGELLDRYDALICPTTGAPGLRAGKEYVDTKLTVNGVELDHYMEYSLTTVFNIASRCPVLNVPSGRASNGVPTGVQIVGRSYEDATVFHVGAAVEHVRPWTHRPESL
ncbi:aspartyl-tRNA(Asn)/glutamyl-tRNA(Gln) amidotransferase subunit A [Nonomuraea polychroma]|uniref:Aspartyl-tRNA(Asn)/glutamyl-tRNA(Gln) amidotransferase subunit A n=1 Tax=Nonomuraea polychroma TaxID=46176 RepID=A0A438LZU4_9ACTN|nr:amidase [Nonomuraea polychroma]RVX39094.1 aspartyl-tRNA(Asn)/glutamyl-tRNA(Gln) amidotransferase subunit A [Nonomuraea polychroma]